MSGNTYRPDVNKVQKLVSKGASIILNDIEKYNSNLLKIANELQNLTNGRCQGNLYFSNGKPQKLLDLILICTMFLQFILKERKFGIYMKILRISN